MRITLSGLLASTLLLAAAVPVLSQEHSAALPGAAAPGAAAGVLNLPVVASGGAAPASAGTPGDGPHWDYTGAGDPSVWAELSDEFKACGTGLEQSPIDIERRDLMKTDFEPVGINWLPFVPEFINNGHTLQVNTGGKAGYAELGGVRYQLLQFHFHAHSEHLIDGKASPMEVHFVNKNAAGKLLVIGAMVEAGAANTDIATLWKQIPANGEKVEIATQVDPMSLIPRVHASYRYAGSLTTPPCSEIVTWNVYAEPVTLSSDQIGGFTAIYPMNARPVQPLGRRFVLGDSDL